MRATIEKFQKHILVKNIKINITYTVKTNMNSRLIAVITDINTLMHGNLIMSLHQNSDLCIFYFYSSITYKWNSKLLVKYSNRR